LHTDADLMIDILNEQHSWLPVYLPLFTDGITVKTGDRLIATITRQLCHNRFNPDYLLEGALYRQGQTTLPIHYHSYHLNPHYRDLPFYQKLFAHDIVPVQPKLDARMFRDYLSQYLPDYMIPSHFTVLNALPLTPNGKVDRDKLPTPDDLYSPKIEKAIEPQTEVEQLQIHIVDPYLQPDPIGLPDELHIGGVDLAHEYKGQSDLTAPKFIPNSNDSNSQLGEIEAILSQHPDVQKTVVIAREEPGNQHLIAYIVSDLIPERIPYQTECLVKWHENTLKCHTEDISNSGILLGKTVTFNQGQELCLHFLLPGEYEARWLKGKVAWSKTSWAGIEFILTPYIQTLIKHSIEYLLETQGILKILQRLLIKNLRNYLKEHLPPHRVPSHIVLLNSLPLTPNGKVDHDKLPAPEEVHPSKIEKTTRPPIEVEQLITNVWQEVLNLNKVGIYDNFFDLGGHSLHLVQIQAKLQTIFAKKISIVKLFEYPTIHTLAQNLGQTQCTPAFVPEPQPSVQSHASSVSNEIAIIGMSGRFPGAKNIEAFWQNMREGVESISFFSDEELKAVGVNTATMQQPNYVKASAILQDIEQFDAAFFGFSPRDASVMDPQQRVFLECAVEALENAGYEMDTDEYTIGVYAGMSMDTYFLKNLYPNRESLSASVSIYQLLTENDKDFLPTRVSYLLNLKGPSINVQTACSTSLVAVSLACDSLLEGHCDIVLAGGISVSVPQKTGYLYQEGMISSPDGHCRTFDAKAQGTIGGNGVGIVVLKRLEEAIKEGDFIHAVIKGSAINNDGSVKVGYTAPSVEGQTAVISKAQSKAGVEAKTITYIEAHGTGTKLGDPIEIAALTNAFRANTQKNGFCAIGSVKTNIGHTDAAAGIAGLIKTVQALKHQLLPPSLHFKKPNPQIDFADSPFYVNTKLSEWKQIEGTPRRAGVSSFGIGGTNAHVILEEAPIRKPSEPGHRSWQLLVLSAKTPSALETTTVNLATYLEQHPDANIADVAYTLSKGRKAFNHRRMLICQNLDEATTALRTLYPTCVFTYSQELKERPVVFMFSGQGAQYVDMALELYQSEPTFREQVDFCSEYLKPQLGLDLRQVLYPHLEIPSLKKKGRAFPAEQQLNQTAITQVALFVIEYALAKLWMAWGIYPEAMIGHSIGEYVAACLSGVFSLEEALSLVAARGHMMQTMPRGAMLAVSLPEEKVQSYLGNRLSLAAINTPDLCVISGVTEAVNALEKQLTEQAVECRRLHTSHAFHSEMMTPILAAFTKRVELISLCSPQIPYLSNVTGTWMTASDVTNPIYWARHLRQTVRFSDGLQQLLKTKARILLEIGPGRTLTTLAKRHPDKTAEQVVLSSLRHPQDKQSDVVFLLKTLGKVWLSGGHVDWSGFYAHEHRHRLPLPTYPFERQRYWIDPPHENTSEVSKTSEVSQLLAKNPDIADWFYLPYWKPSVLPAIAERKDLASWLVFEDASGLGSRLVKQLKPLAQKIITVKVGSAFTKQSDYDYTLNPQLSSDYEALVKELCNQMPQMIVHFWGVTHQKDSTLEGIEKAQDFGFYSLLFLAQSLGKQNVTDEIQIAVVSNNMQAVTGEEALFPEKATVLGPVKVIGQEYPNINCRSIDIVLTSSESGIKPRLIEQLQEELASQSSDQVIAYRGEHRWVQTFEPVHLDKPIDGIPRLRERGVYLITGGFGGIGLTLAEHLAKTVQAKLILTGRSTFPARDEWTNWLTTHDEHDSVSRKIKKVQALEAQGTEVLVASADVANLQQMQEMMTFAAERFGKINGVIHAAGIPGGGVIQQKTPKIAESVLAPKVSGAVILYYLFENVQLDFFVLCSSLGSILEAFGQVDYCGANAFLDAFTHHLRTQGKKAICINWDVWQEVGMAVNTEVPLELQQGRTESLKQGILPKEGIDVFSRIMGNRLPHVLVSTSDFLSRVEQHKVSKIQRFLEISDKANLSKPTHPRPQLSYAHVAPRNELEQTLANIWQTFLGIEQVGIYDDFFELGGDSLTAVQLITKLRKTLKTDLSAHSLLNTPTIAALADFIGKTTPELLNQALPSLLVEIQTGNSLKPPLFLMHPVGGHVYFYRDLASYLSLDQPVYGIQAEGLDGETEPLSQVEEMATHYIGAMRVRQPEGPYFLGGGSFGGMVAFEMAQQLHTLGQKVALLTMIDTPGPTQMPVGKFETDVEILVYLLNVEENLSVSLDELRKLEPDEQLRYFLEEQRKLDKPIDLDITQVRHFLHIFKVHVQAMRDYQARVYPGKIIFFRAQEKDAYNAKNPERAWIDLSQELEVIDVPGNHMTITKSPHVQIIADRLKTYLS
jgi:acyl transferase domain-containing protein/thioesterase domain-containing protein/acyl carrier protein